MAKRTLPEGWPGSTRQRGGRSRATAAHCRKEKKKQVQASGQGVPPGYLPGGGRF